MRIPATASRTRTMRTTVHAQQHLLFGAGAGAAALLLDAALLLERTEPPTDDAMEVLEYTLLLLDDGFIVKSVFFENELSFGQLCP
jgi:hypothetical protein